MYKPLKTIAAAVAALSASALFAQAFAARTSMSLDGDWHYIVDQMDVGSKSYHDDFESDRDNMWFGRNVKPKHRSDLVEYDFAASPTMKVPGDWNTQVKELYYYEGVVWYERDFQWTKREGRTFLHFDAVSLEANVYMNGKKLGSHVGGFTPFEFDVTDVVREGGNCVVVKASNIRRRSGIPTQSFDWWNYGGIIRNVRLETRPSTFVKSWRVDLDAGRKALAADIRLDAATPNVPVRLDVAELGVSVAGVTDADGRCALRTGECKIDLWSPSNPKMYKVVVKAGEDEVSDEMGFRTIEAEGRRILLNGEEIYLKGICLHDEAPNGGGRVTTDAEVAENIRRVKELGANFVRLAHYPHNERMVRACERAGILAWCEIPLYWMIDWKNPATYESAASQAREMIERDIRRANVVIWSLANETVPSKARTEFLTRLAAYARSLDSTRLISLAMEVTGAKNCVNRLSDDINAVVDIVAFNEYIGWYRNVADADKMVWEIPYDKPVVISEFGGGAVAGRHGAADERWTEEMQNAIYEANIRMFSRIEGLCGTCPWILTDFRSPRRTLVGVQDGYNRKGLFAPDGTKKLAFGTMKRFYESGPWSCESALRARLPEIFAKSAAHYKALDAAATPLMNSGDAGGASANGGKPYGERRVPHGWNAKTGKLDMRSIYWWTTGHYPGSLWYLYEATGDEFFKERATAWSEWVAPNSKVSDNHDVGFIMYCSFGNARRILKTDKYDGLLRETAESLAKRFHPGLGLLRSWGDIGEKREFLVIPDNMMNLELLEWAGHADARFDEIARSHATNTMKHHFRADGGTYHVLNYDQRPGFLGQVQEIRRGQGLSCETAWSRGQSWAIYGYTMMYRETGDAAYLEFAQKVADYAINHPNMPGDGVPYWDFGAPGEERDSSAAAIMAAGLLELARHVAGEKGGKYRAFAARQLLTLSSAEYFSEGGEIGHWLLKHGVGHKPERSEIDTPLDYGDYYFLEALLRFAQPPEDAAF